MEQLNPLMRVLRLRMMMSQLLSVHLINHERAKALSTTKTRYQSETGGAVLEAIKLPHSSSALESLDNI